MKNLSTIIANISWNDFGWRNIYINPHAGHSYTRNNPGHESLNFKFDKNNLDTNKHIFGFVQWTYPPKDYINGGIILFYSKNLKNHNPEIVGIYCNAYILNEINVTSWEGFLNNELTSNIKAEKELSLLFPIPLNAKKYSVNRLVGQIGFSYSDTSFAEKIIIDEIHELSKSGLQKQEYHKLNQIYNFINGNEYFIDSKNSDEIEQYEIINNLKDINKLEIINDLKNLKETDPEFIEVKHKIFKRDNKTIAQLKIIHDFKCQICSNNIKKKNGEFYIEAAHIKPKRDKGTELPYNIMILCPNHHKEFDLGALNIIHHDIHTITFNLNGIDYKICLDY